MNTLKYYCLRYQPYLVGMGFFLLIFLVWAVGRALGFSSLSSLLSGIGVFLLLSAGYVLLLYRGAGQHHNLEGLLRDDADQAVLNAAPADREEVSLLRERLLDSLERLRGSRARGASANDALYALPWYLVIGQPAAGKSTMILQSGLNFPYAEREGARVAGLGGTRHCDWFFSAEAVLLDTAGRYMNSPEEAGKWRGFLQLLRQHRQRRPLNGLIVSVSMADLLYGTEDDLNRVAKRLRERIQESSDTLEVRLPIYLVLTKCDLIPGFIQFFRQLDDDAKAEVVGTTFAHAGFEQSDWGRRCSDALDRMTQHWQRVADRQLTQQDIQITRQNDAAYRFPLELAALKPRLHAFIDALLRANPYQQAQLLRGFYFTTALQGAELAAGPHEQHVSARFAVNGNVAGATAQAVAAPLFIDNLFRKVIIPDQHLVALYTSNRRERRRKALWVGAASLAGVLLCGLWGWSYFNNRAVIAQIEQQLQAAETEDRANPAQYAAWHSLDTLRVWTAHYYSQHHEQGVPYRLRMGLYQGYALAPTVRAAYFAALQPVMLKPTGDNLIRTLSMLPTHKVYKRSTQELRPLTGIDSIEPKALPQDNRAESIANFGTTALNTYSMLLPAQREKADPAFIKDHLPDFWYPDIARRTGMPLANAEDSVDYRYASRQIGFYSEQIREPDVPRLVDNAFLVSSSRNYINSLRAQTLRAIETITLESDTLFAFGRADFQSLRSEGQQQLSVIAAKLLNTPNIGKIVISGHADQLGDAQGNLQVSRQRAQTIRTYLVGKGVPAELVEAQGEGSRKPLVNCNMQQPRAQLIKCLEPNRRVEIEVRGPQ